MKWLENVPTEWRGEVVPLLSEEAKFQIERLWQDVVGLDSTYPVRAEVFAALAATRPEEVKVVVLGQDPYHQPGQAHGLAFSVRHGVKPPPSLRNLLKELAQDIPCHRWMEPKVGHGVLSGWTEEGVLLLNATLTVSQGNPGSHQGLGWEALLDAVLEVLSGRDQPLVFMLLGKQAAAFASRIHQPNHLIIEAPHPSPLSAHRGFFGSKPFSRANQWLQDHQVDEVDWWRGIPNA